MRDEAATTEDFVLKCRECNQPLLTTGSRGLCPRCLSACTEERPPDTGNQGEAAGEDGLGFGVAVGANDRFLLLDKLGEGGMGEVWLAKDKELSRANADHLVALKFISHSIRHNSRAFEAIRDEVLSSQSLSHPNIVRIFDLHVSPNGLPFIKMEFIPGNSLRRWLHGAPQHVMPWRMACHLTRQLASALLYAHDTVGIVHRDIKPGNLLLAEDNVLKLSDFGIALPIKPDAVGDGMVALGTLAYASPQQLAGARPTPADDIYSVGATLYELLTGTPPFEAETPEAMIDKVHREVPEPIPQRLKSLGRSNNVPAKLLILVQRCLDEDPLCRPKTREIAQMLPLAAGEGPDAGYSFVAQDGAWEQPRKSSGSRGWLRTVCLSLLIAGLAGWFWLSNQSGVTPRAGEQSEITPPAPVNTDVRTGDDSTGRASTEEDRKPLSPSESGRLVVSIKSAVGDRSWHQCVISDKQGTVVAQETLPANKLLFAADSLKPGTYQLRVSERSVWTIESTVQVSPGQTTEVPVQFVWQELAITSEPPGARVNWPPGKMAKTSEITPFTNRFQAGNLQLTATLPGHLMVQTNYSFNPSLSARLHLMLQKSAAPLRREPWTNSLGTVFCWVDALSLWAGTTETTVAEFRRFAEDARYDATAGMRSLTASGFQPLGDSWIKPGFRQQDDHPVVGVSWDDATAFCTWLTRRERTNGGLTQQQFYWLPMTNQWFELASGKRFPWGDSLEVRGNYSGEEAATLAPWPQLWPVIVGHDDKYPRTAPVGSMGANGLGFYHLGGNAAEWCAEQVLCGRSWCDGECDDPKNEPDSLSYLETRQVQAADPKERTARNGFRVMIYPGD